MSDWKKILLAMASAFALTGASFAQDAGDGDGEGGEQSGEEGGEGEGGDTGEGEGDGDADGPEDGDGDGDAETPEPAGAGAAVSEAAQALGELDPDEVEGPGISAAAQELRGIAMENLPEQAQANRPENAGPPEGAGRPAKVRCQFLG